MGTNPTKAADNIYCKCRKEAAKYNDKLNSREGAAELLGISASTLADYELGITKIIPADVILRMADLYNAPELRNHYCKYSCPLGQDVPLVDTESLDRIAVRALASLKKVQESKENLLDVVADGVISEDEKPILHDSCITKSKSLGSKEPGIGGFMGAVRTAPRPFLTVKEVMILLGCKEDFAYKTMRKINKESESQGYISIGSGKVNKHLFADKLQIPEEDIEQAIQYVAAQENR